ncbi:nucleoside hydrolase [Caldilinea aerophila]|uniref:Putative nucleosidase n=1 Tax=Caldilinea aerophila (strain DSM 14535 / JCM 11387 / NBRC 104270 / STL-6-O1) TaxID=926550 RepID=I0HZD0_CALAS|nr:nucleoside hydrolase [Caldilinea aerophila]BAL98367.1 putative nucleosidase [Caldilinea aerophila DSM 14535 = NBRC 104270]
MKVLLDTDIGSDIDDAICLAYLLARPDCELLGITTVTGEPEQRAMLASAICKAAGRELPIFPGAPRPLLAAVRQPHAPQAAALERWPHETSFPAGRAIGFMRDVIRSHPGEVTLLTIGPLTNVALLFTLDPEIPHLLKALYMMAGSFARNDAGMRLEWNALNDPHAATVVYNARPPIHRSIGLDVTLQVRMDADEVRRRFQAPLLRPVLDMAEIWFRERPEIVFHDPLAAAAIFDEQICAYERGVVEVELASARLAGLTHFSPEPGGPHEVAATVDAERFFREYFAVTAS